jgi:transcriptional regulator with XRE-family HTH domain
MTKTNIPRTRGEAGRLRGLRRKAGLEPTQHPGMLAAMAAAGIRTASELSRRSGVQKTTIGYLLNRNMRPVYRDGWRTSVLRIAETLGVAPQDMFPNEIEIVTSRVEKIIETRQLRSMCGYTRAHPVLRAYGSLPGLVNNLLDTLKPSMRSVITQYALEGRTMHDIARARGVTRQYVSMLVRDALGALRHPCRRDMLEECREVMEANK